MTSDLKIIKPEHVHLDGKALAFNRTANVALAIKALEEGIPVIITEFYNNGLLLLKELHAHLQKKLPNNSYQEQRAYRSAFYKLSHLILIEIVDHKLKVKKAPFIGWLEKLYPEITDFVLPFPQVQGLNSSWQWCQKGISIPVLRNKLHPHYGTYFPTRFDHLRLFDNWLKRYEGPKKFAIDVGIGCGVLSFQLLKYGFQKVYGTDTNPNAIVGLAEFMGDTKLSRKIELEFAPFFGTLRKKSELIVFNPPWLPKTLDQDCSDEAIYYNEELFPDFFAGAIERLLPDGKVAVLFSNFAQIANITKEHPIETELSQGGRFQLERCFKKKVKQASNQRKRGQHWRDTEVVELWILTRV